MIDVSEETKTEWVKDSSHKEIRILMSNNWISNDEIVQGSFKYTENIISSDTLEVIGCIAKKIEFSTSAFNRIELKGQRVSVVVRAGETDYIQIFTGTVDDVRKESMRGIKRVIAYDDFYKMTNTDATEWWNNLGETTLIGSFVDFIANFDINYNPQKVDFINPSIPCHGGTIRKVKNFSALDYLKHLCQINGCIGYTDGQGRFAIKYINPAPAYMLYPSNSLFPSNDIYPSNYQSSGDYNETSIAYYRDLEYDDYSVKSIGRIKIRGNSRGQAYEFSYFPEGKSANTYIIQGNIFTFDQEDSVIHDIAFRLYEKLSKVSYKPFTANHNAYPWLECGDNVSYWDRDENGNQVRVALLIVSRTMSGDQNMWDTFSASGEEVQSVYISDLKAQIDDLKNQIEDK
jgi:hypothetical protein